MNWTLFLLGAAAGGFINGLAGFGTALFALGLWLQFLPPVQAVSIVLVISVITGLQGLWLVRHSIFNRPERLIRFLVPGLLGIPLGVLILAAIDAHILKQLVAGFLVLYGGYFAFRRTLPKFSTPTPIIDCFVGLIGGILGGAASLSGALPTMWLSLRPWTKSETRAVLQPYNVCILSLTAVALAIQGAYSRETLLLLSIALPVSLVAAQFGIVLFKRIEDETFRRLLILLTLTSGLVLLARELFLVPIQ